MNYRRAPRLGARGNTAVLAAVLLTTIALPAGAAGAKKKAELVVTKLGNPPATLSAGAQLTISDTVANRRGKAKASATAYFLSEDKFRDLADVQVGSRSVRKLKAKKSSRGTANLTVPTVIPTGTYRLLACADAENRVKERSESNNCRASKGTTQVAGIDPADTTPPATPAITDTDPDSPADDTTPAVKGTGAEADSTVRVYATGDCSGAPIGTGAAAAFNGATGVTVTVSANQTTNLRATATDVANNVSPCSAPFAYTDDSSLPAAPTITDTDPDSPANDNNPEVKGTGADAGSTVRIYSTADCSGAPIGTGTAATFAGVGITAPVPGDMTTNLRATATDSVGHVSPCSAPFAYTEDSIVPPTPSISGTAPTSPGNDITPQVKGSAEAGSTVQIYDNATCSAPLIGNGPAATFASPGITATGTVAANTTTNLRATATDAAGNVSGCSGPFAYTEDSLAPAAPTITDTDPDPPADDNNPEVKGTGAEAGSTVRIYSTVDCSGSPIGVGTEALFAGSGISVTVPVPDDQVTNLRVTATDAANNVSTCSAPFAYTEDSTSPPSPTITATNPASPANDPTPEVIGTAEAGSTVNIHSTVDCSGAALGTGSAALFGGAGITVTVAVDATTNLRATATDAAGHVSTCSAPFAYTEDSTP